MAEPNSYISPAEADAILTARKAIDAAYFPHLQSETEKSLQEALRLLWRTEWLVRVLGHDCYSAEVQKSLDEHYEQVDALLKRCDPNAKCHPRNGGVAPLEFGES